MLNTGAAANRTTSAFPVSVATSLAIESIFETNSASIDPNRVIPQKIDLHKYKEFWINLSTLFRNLFTSLAKEDSKRVLPRELADALFEEAEIIESLSTEETHGSTRVIFYVCNYQDLALKHPNALLRTDNTDNQKIYRHLHDSSIALFLKLREGSENIIVTDNTLKPKSKVKALILTHIAYDLLSAKNFQSLELLESHTGVLKGPSQWSTKYLHGRELSMLPFNKAFLQVMGDSETFRPLGVKIKNDIVELAKSRNWTSLTTRDKIISDLDFLKNPYFKEIIRSML